MALIFSFARTIHLKSCFKRKNKCCFKVQLAIYKNITIDSCDSGLRITAQRAPHFLPTRAERSLYLRTLCHGSSAEPSLRTAFQPLPTAFSGTLSHRRALPTAPRTPLCSPPARSRTGAAPAAAPVSPSGSPPAPSARAALPRPDTRLTTAIPKPSERPGAPPLPSPSTAPHKAPGRSRPPLSLRCPPPPGTAQRSPTAPTAAGLGASLPPHAYLHQRPSGRSSLPAAQRCAPLLFLRAARLPPPGSAVPGPRPARSAAPQPARALLRDSLTPSARPRPLALPPPLPASRPAPRPPASPTSGGK